MLSFKQMVEGVVLDESMSEPVNTETLQELGKEIERKYGLVVRVTRSTLGGADRASHAIHAYSEKSTWKHNIAENAPIIVKIMVDHEGTIENLRISYQIKNAGVKPLRKVKAKNNADIKKKILAYFDKNITAMKTTINESLEEASGYQTNHKDYSSAVQHAVAVAKKRGYEVDDEDYDRKVALGPKKPSSGKTNSFSIALTKGGKPSKQLLHFQVYNADNKFYELNMYID